MGKKYLEFCWKTLCFFDNLGFLRVLVLKAYIYIYHKIYLGGPTLFGLHLGWCFTSWCGLDLTRIWYSNRHVRHYLCLTQHGVLTADGTSNIECLEFGIIFAVWFTCGDGFICLAHPASSRSCVKCETEFTRERACFSSGLTCSLHSSHVQESESP